MPRRLTDRELLLLVLAQIQQHARSLRTSLDAADAALGSVEALGGTAPGIELVRSSLDEVGRQAGEIQTILAASAQLAHSSLIADGRPATLDT